MAEAKGTLTTGDVWDDAKRIHVVGKLAVSAGPDTYTTGGIAFDPVVNVVDGANLGIPLPTVQQQPIWGNLVGGTYFGQYNPTTKKLKLLAIAGGAEVASGAVPAPLSSDVINAYFIFKKF